MDNPGEFFVYDPSIKLVKRVVSLTNLTDGSSSLKQNS